MRSHEWIDQRSLALDRRIAEKLRANPALIQHATTTLRHWVEQREPSIPPVLREWQEILGQHNLDEILARLTEDDAAARRLRQSSPFCGILSPEERLAIFQQYEARRA